METWQDIKDFFFSAVQDTEEGQYFYNTTQAAAWANGALWEMAQESKYLDVIAEQDTADGQAIYYVGGNGTPPFGLWRVEIDDEKISAITQDRLRQFSRTWKSVSGKPNYYYLDNIHYLPDYYSFGLWEEPNGVYECRTYSYGCPAQVSDSADNDYLQVPRWAIYGVLWYMLSEAYLVEGPRQNADTSMFYRMLYEDVLERLQARKASKMSEKRWVVGGHSGRRDSFWDNMPEHIPEP